VATRGYLVQVSLTLVNGGASVVPMAFFSDAEKAERVKAERDRLIRSLLECRLVRVADGDEVEDTGLSLLDVFRSLGIAGVGHNAVGVEDNSGPSIVVASSLPRVGGT